MHAIDFALVSERAAGYNQDYEVDYAKLDTDHRVLKLYVLSPRKPPRRRGCKKPRWRFRLELMVPKSSKKDQAAEAAAAANKYQQCLATSFAVLWM